jgi:small-conductance mechanosensitive channel
LNVELFSAKDYNGASAPPALELKDFMNFPSLDGLLRGFHHLAAQSGYKAFFWSAALIACAFLCAAIHSRRLRHRAGMSLEQKRQARASFRNGLLLAAVAGLGFVWGGEIRSLILSLAAIAAALMIVSKEMISCFYGGLLFTFSKLATIGDSIEVGPHRGELLDHNWLSFTLLEHADTHFYTGKIVKIPNSLLLGAPLINQSQGGLFRFCTINFHARQDHASAALECALAAAQDVCGAWIDDARSHMSALQSKHLTLAPDVAPRAALISVDKDALMVSLRFAAPASSRAATQAEVSRLYFERFEAHLKAEKQQALIEARQALAAPAQTSTLVAAP